MDFNLRVEGNILRGWERSVPAVEDTSKCPGSTSVVIQVVKDEQPKGSQSIIASPSLMVISLIPEA